MKSLAVGLTAVALLSSGVAKEATDYNLPVHSTWAPATFGDFEFRIAEIDIGFSVRVIESPPPIDRGTLASCANWFIHHWYHTKNLEELRSLLESDDDFQTVNPFERLSRMDRAVMERSYSHIIDFRGFYFLIGTMGDTKNKKERVIGTYRWDDETGRFNAILDTPRFRGISGWEFRRALYKIDLETLSMIPIP